MIFVVVAELLLHTCLLALDMYDCFCRILVRGAIRSLISARQARKIYRLTTLSMTSVREPLRCHFHNVHTIKWTLSLTAIICHFILHMKNIWNGMHCFTRIEINKLRIFTRIVIWANYVDHHLWKWYLAFPKPISCLSNNRLMVFESEIFRFGWKWW